MKIKYAAFAALSAVLVACGGGDPDFIECRDDSSCDLRDGGRCLVYPASGNQFCAYPDENCSGDFRWSDLDVPSEIAGDCVGDELFDAGIDAPDSGIDADVGAPSVVSVSPVDEATMVSTTTGITVTFSEPVAEDSITSTTFQLSGPGGPVTGTFLIDGENATLSPSARLDPDVEYTVSVTTGVTDEAGNALTAAFSSSFTTRDGGWTDPVLLELDQNSAVRDFDATMRPGGRGAAVWVSRACAGQSCGGAFTVYASLYNAGTWSTPETVGTTADATGIQGPKITVDSSGNAIVTFVQRSASFSSIWASRRPAAGAWSTPALIETEQLGHADGLRLSGDSAGNAYAVWYQHDGTANNVWANRYSVGTGWGTALKLENSTGSAATPNVVAQNDGTATAMWMLANTGVDAYFARYTGTWSTPALVGGVAGGGGGSAPTLRVDSNGGVIAIWIGGTDLIAARYNGAWTSPAAIDAPTATGGIMVPPALATSTNGKAFAIWSQGATGNTSLYQSMFDGTIWNSAFLLESFANISQAGTVAFGVGDRAMTVWNQEATTVAGWSTEHRPAMSWQTPESIPSGEAGTVLYDDQRNVFINVWSQAVVGFESMYWNEYE